MADVAVFETDAMLMRGALPLNLLGSNGTLRLENGRVRFAKRNGQVVFDARVDELADLRPLASVMLRFSTNGTKRLVAIGSQVYASHLGGVAGMVVDAVKLPGALSTHRSNKELTQEWLKLLRAPTTQR